MVVSIERPFRDLMKIPFVMLRQCFGRAKEKYSVRHTFLEEGRSNREVEKTVSGGGLCSVRLIKYHVGDKNQEEWDEHGM